MIRLGVNIDHVATVRNVRGETYPDPVQAAVMAELGGADNITCHLREDRRHIRDRDVRLLRETIKVPLNFEMASTDEMVEVACQTKPHAVTLVPEKRAELTTEGGLAHAAFTEDLERKVARLKKLGILVSLFIETEEKAIRLASALGADAVEFHTGGFCHRMDAATHSMEKWDIVKPLRVAATYAHKLGMQVHFGHGLNYGNAQWLQTVPYCEEANIGHAIIARALFVGLERAVREMKDLLNDPRYTPKEL